RVVLDFALRQPQRVHRNHPADAALARRSARRGRPAGAEAGAGERTRGGGMKGVKRSPVELAESYATQAMKAIRRLRKIGGLDRFTQDGIVDGLRMELNKVETVWEESPLFVIPKPSAPGSLSERIATLSKPVGAPGLLPAGGSASAAVGEGGLTIEAI